MARTPFAAGKYYPADKITLINQINSFLEKSKKLKKSGKLRVLIVPHAGYDYSGQTAGWGFKQLEKTNFTQIIILGSSHQAYFSNAAIDDKDFWQTPLGDIQIDKNLRNTLINESNLFTPDSTAHEQEHSIEVEIPFLQHIFSDVKILPILLGQTTDQSLKNIAKTISNNFNNQTLLVISSDLSHYPAYKTANNVDKKTIDSILTGNEDRFIETANKGLSQPGVETCACAKNAIKVGMIIADNLGIKDIKLLNYVNSGDLHGDKNHVVGYAAIGFYSDKKTGRAGTHAPVGAGQTLNRMNSKITEELNKSQQNRLLEIARQTLKDYLKHKKVPKISVEDEALKQKLGAFVTLKTKKGQLKGCIGKFGSDEALYKVIQEKTIDSAIHDPRFPKIEYCELNDIDIEISVISEKQKIDDWQKIELGKHGVIVKKGLRSGTFLPQVAKAVNWDLETFLSNLCSKKAGLSPSCYKDPEVEIFIFTAQVFGENK